MADDDSPCQRGEVESLSFEDGAASTHMPILITSKRSNAILIAEDDWRAIQYG